MKHSPTVIFASILSVVGVSACVKLGSSSHLNSARSTLRCSSIAGVSLVPVGSKFSLQTSNQVLPFQFTSRKNAQTALDIIKAQKYSQLCQYGDGVNDFSYFEGGSTTAVSAAETCTSASSVTLGNEGAEYVLRLNNSTIARLGLSVDVARGALNIIQNKNYDEACLITGDTSGFVHFVNTPVAPPQPTRPPQGGDTNPPSRVHPEVHLRTNYGRVVRGADVILSWSTQGVSYCSLQILGVGGRNIGVERNAYLSFVINEPTRFQLSCKSDATGEYVIDYVFVDINRAPDRPN